MPTRLGIHMEGLINDWRTLRIASQVKWHSPVGDGQHPVIVFNASSRLNSLSQNAAFSMLAGWGASLAGQPVIHFVCERGMSRCVLGTDQDDFSKAPPCRACIRQSRINAHASAVHRFHYQDDPQLMASLQNLSLEELTRFEIPLLNGILPLGELVLASIRWRLRRSDLSDDENTRHLLREYMLSAWNVAMEFLQLVEKVDPAAVLVFNGQFFPEAVVRWICKQKGIFSVTHEVSMQPLSGFFTPGEATAYPLELPDEFTLDEERNRRLDAYLEERLQGNFSMAGIRFWPQMKPLDPHLVDKMANFKQVVPIFTNVIFDTSQPHSNVIFPDMFTWLDLVLKLVKQNPETLFVLRAHPDEKRAGKQSLQSVSAWVEKNQARSLPNLAFVDSLEYLSSYELIERSKFILIYNSTIGLEAAILGKAVLAAGWSRFSPYNILFFPDSMAAYQHQLEGFLLAESIAVPADFRTNARRFLYYLLYHASMPFDEFLEASLVPGVVRLKKFNWRALTNSLALRSVISGLLEQKPFVVDQE